MTRLRLAVAWPMRTPPSGVWPEGLISGSLDFIDDSASSGHFVGFKLWPSLPHSPSSAISSQGISAGRSSRGEGMIRLWFRDSVGESSTLDRSYVAMTTVG
jgi:hypothetical protein